MRVALQIPVSDSFVVSSFPAAKNLNRTIDSQGRTAGARPKLPFIDRTQPPSLHGAAELLCSSILRLCQVNNARSNQTATSRPAVGLSEECVGTPSTAP
jgi:hypothetical protein